MHKNYEKNQKHAQDVENTPTEQSTEKGMEKNTRPQWLPEKFWNGEQVNIKALAQSYKALEKKMSSRSHPKNHTALATADVAPCEDISDASTDSPAQNNTQAEENALQQKDPLYTIDITSPHIKRDKEIEQTLFDQGFSNTQVQTMYTLAEHYLAPIIEQMHTVNVENIHKDLENHFGGKDTWNTIRESLANWAKANLPKDTVQHLASSAEGIKNLYAMMQASKEHCLSNNNGETETLTEEKLRHMMNDPRYWREKEASYIQKVQQGFKTVFPEKS